MNTFSKATKKKSKLRLAIYGPSGSGKTYSALKIATALGGPLAVIDTERGSASKYAGDVAVFDVLELESYEPAKYIAALHSAAVAGYPTIVVDSLSHAWSGKGGLLDQANDRGGRFDAWKTLTPQHHALVDAILAYPGDLIVTLRTKTEYVVEQNDKGKSTPRKIGTAPVQKEGLEYEFDIAGSMDVMNNMTIEKSRCPGLQGTVIKHPGAELAATLRAWLSDGVDAPHDRDAISDEIATCASIDQLESLGASIKAKHAAGDISNAKRQELGALYIQKKKELSV